MRAMFGLVALMVGVAIILLLWSQSVPTVLNKGKKAEEQIRPNTENPMGSSVSIPGQPAPDRIKYVGDQRGLVVDDIGPANPMVKYYGLRKGDRIVQVGPVSLRGESENDAKTFVLDGYTYHRTLIVERGPENQRVTLDFPQ